MKEEWVKLFVIEGIQVIVTIEADDTDDECKQYVVSSKTIIDDVTIEMPVTYKNEELARRIFNKCDENFATLVINEYYHLIKNLAE